MHDPFQKGGFLVLKRARDGLDVWTQLLQAEAPARQQLTRRLRLALSVSAWHFLTRMLGHQRYLVARLCWLTGRLADAIAAAVGFPHDN